MIRFVDTELTTTIIGEPIRDYSTKESLNLEQALKPMIFEIDELNRSIVMAKEKCHFPSEDNLTLDESAALFLYTMEFNNNNNLYQMIKKDFHSKDNSISNKWFEYLQLFHNALKKLPNVEMNVWTGINKDFAEKIHPNDELISLNIISCSSSINVIQNNIKSNSRLCFIETLNGKDISNYSMIPNQKEIILWIGTCLHMVDYVESEASIQTLHLRELNNKCNHHSSSSALLNSRVKTKTFPSHYNRLFSLVPHIIVLIIALVLVTTITIPWTRFIFSSDEFSIFDEHIDEHGNRYQGQWIDGKKNGKGKMNFVNGCKYTGDWFNDMRTGEGTFIWANGDQYKGQFLNDQRHGQGVYDFANGNKYIGDWIEDKRSGNGISTWGSESPWNGDTYHGEFLNDNIHGNGTYHFASGDKYTGGWIDNKQEGQGIYTWSNGNRYEGGFKGGKMHGKGIVYYSNGNKLTDEWVDGTQLYNGSFTWAPRSEPSNQKENKPKEGETSSVNDENTKVQ